MDARYIFFKKIRKLYLKMWPEQKIYLQPHTQGQKSSDLIKERLADKAPCMICRFGKTELDAIMTHLTLTNNQSFFPRVRDFITGKTEHFSWDNDIRYQLSNNAGFFPSVEPYLTKFTEYMLKVCTQIDILGSWLPGESELISFFPNAKIIELIDLEPYCHKNPWSEELQGKKVLVVHPFTSSILSQYKKRENLFHDKRVLPSFELRTFRAIQSIANTNVGFKTWFDALDYMCQEISKIDFEIALIGAGAYGLPLAAFIKSIGKKGIHLGGATQILFGIQGKRWDERDFYQKLYNEHWVRPAEDEIPKNFRRVESGCYW